MPILTRTPGPQVGLYKAHNGITWLRSPTGHTSSRLFERPDPNYLSIKDHLKPQARFFFRRHTAGGGGAETVEVQGVEGAGFQKEHFS